MSSATRPEIVRNADLARLSTFALPARADELAVLESPGQVRELLSEPERTLVLGGGSNTVFVGDFHGRIVLNRLSGIRFERVGEHVRVTAAAGENWHRLVRRCMDRGAHGLENLALIPGSVGAAPMQNIGAYGVELAETVESLEAFDRRTGGIVTLDRDACGFTYRDSRFKSAEPGRFLITSITLRLSRRFVARTDYESLGAELNRLGIEQPRPRQLAAAVIRLRRHRLPDPGRIANAGSFFKNPIVDGEIAESLLTEHPGLPRWPLPDGRVKLSAGWMIERLGWKGRSVGDAAVYPNHALVLVNRGRARPQDLLALVGRITESVQSTFGIGLEPEPRLIGAGATAIG